MKYVLLMSTSDISRQARYAMQGNALQSSLVSGTGRYYPCPGSEAVMAPAVARAVSKRSERRCSLASTRTTSLLCGAQVRPGAKSSTLVKPNARGSVTAVVQRKWQWVIILGKGE